MEASYCERFSTVYSVMSYVGSNATFTDELLYCKACIVVGIESCRKIRAVLFESAERWKRATNKSDNARDGCDRYNMRGLI